MEGTPDNMTNSSTSPAPVKSPQQFRSEASDPQAQTEAETEQFQHEGFNDKEQEEP